MTTTTNRINMHQFNRLNRVNLSGPHTPDEYYTCTIQEDGHGLWFLHMYNEDGSTALVFCHPKTDREMMDLILSFEHTQQESDSSLTLLSL